MKFGKNHSVFFSEDTTNISTKFSMIRELSTGELLSNLRNIEDEPTWFDESIVKAIFSELFKRNIMCI